MQSARACVPRALQRRWLEQRSGARDQRSVAAARVERIEEVRIVLDGAPQQALLSRLAAEAHDEAQAQQHAEAEGAGYDDRGEGRALDGAAHNVVAA